jgi:hypothetical protein
MRPLALHEPSAAIEGGTDERVPELDARGSDAYEALQLGDAERVDIELQPGRSALDGRSAPSLLRRRHEEDRAGFRRQPAHAFEVRLLHRGRRRHRRDKRLVARELTGAERRRELDERQRIPVRSRQHPVDRVGRRSGAHAGRDELAGIRGAERHQPKLGNPDGRERPIRVVAGRKDERDPLGVEPACGEHQGLGRGLIEPLRIVD